MKERNRSGRSRQINRKGLDDLLESTPEMNPTARMILMSYARTMQYVTEVQTTWQSQETIAKFAGVSEDTLKDYTKALVADGYLILVKEEQLGNNKVKRFYALGSGTLKTAILKRRERNRGASNLVPGAKQIKAKEKSLGTTQELEEAETGAKTPKPLGPTQGPSLGTTQNRPLGGTETNTKPYINRNTVKPDELADAPSSNDTETNDKEEHDTLIFERNDLGGGAANAPEPSSIVPTENPIPSISTTEGAASGNNPEAWDDAPEPIDSYKEAAKKARDEKIEWYFRRVYDENTRRRDWGQMLVEARQRAAAQDDEEWL